MKEEMIRDQLVVGIRDNSLSESLQTDPDLTLEKAKTKIRQKEAVREQQQTLKGADGATSPIGISFCGGLPQRELARTPSYQGFTPCVENRLPANTVCR